jgi:uncharacterized protein DUF3987
VTAPDTAAGTRFWRPESEGTDRALRRYGARLLSILETPLPLRSGVRNELEPRCVALVPEARARWIEYAAHIERELKPDGELECIRGLASKLPEHAARLAAVLTLVRDLHAKEVTAADITAGIALAEHYSAEARRLFGVAQVSQDIRHAQNLLKWLLGTWAETAVSLPTVYQKGPRTGAKDKATAAKLVAILEGHGWLIKIPGGALVDGVYRREAWRIIRG